MFSLLFEGKHFNHFHCFLYYWCISSATKFPREITHILFFPSKLAGFLMVSDVTQSVLSPCDSLHRQDQGDVHAVSALLLLLHTATSQQPLSVWRSVSPSVCQHICCLSACQSVCQPVCLSALTLRWYIYFKYAIKEQFHSLHLQILLNLQTVRRQNSTLVYVAGSFVRLHCCTGHKPPCFCGSTSATFCH